MKPTHQDDARLTRGTAERGISRNSLYAAECGESTRAERSRCRALKAKGDTVIRHSSFGTYSDLWHKVGICRETIVSTCVEFGVVRPAESPSLTSLSRSR